MRRRLIGCAAVATLLAATAIAAEPPVAAPAGWIGVTLGRAAASPPAATDIASERPGAVVASVIDGGPADAAGLRAKDVILAVGGTAVTSGSELVRSIRDLAPGSWIPLTVRRGERELDLRVELGPRPDDVSRLRPVRGWVGLAAIDLPQELQEHFGAPAGSGVMISRVEPGSAAEAAGFELGDVVYAVDGEPIATAATLKIAITGSGVGNTIEVELMRAGSALTLEPVVERVPAPAPSPEVQPRS
jgi:serine protease Do